MSSCEPGTLGFTHPDCCSSHHYRYVGKDYSAAQELMEDEMKEFYSKNPRVTPIQTVHVGQLLAVNAEEDAWLRAQIISTDENKIKASSVLLA